VHASVSTHAFAHRPTSQLDMAMDIIFARYMQLRYILGDSFTPLSHSSRTCGLGLVPVQTSFLRGHDRYELTRRLLGLLVATGSGPCVSISKERRRVYGEFVSMKAVNVRRMPRVRATSCLGQSVDVLF
jgi:hypothetical protein